MPRAGAAVHLQEIFRREQTNGLPAHRMPPCARGLRAVFGSHSNGPTAHRMPLCARGLRAVFGSKSGFKEECPRSRECRVQATQPDRQDIIPKKRPNVREKGEASERFHRAACRPVPAGSERYSGQFLSTEHSGPKDGVRNPRDSAERLRGAAVSSQMTTASRNGGLAQDPVQRG